MGIKVIAMCSMTYAQTVDAVHSSGQKLYEFVGEGDKKNDIPFIYEQDVDAQDYVYDIEMHKTLSGKKMQKRRNHFNALGKTFSIKDIEYTYLNYIFNEVTVFVGDNFSLEDIEQLLFGNRSATIEEDTSLWDDGFESEIDELIVRMNEVDIPEDIQSWSIV